MKDGKESDILIVLCPNVGRKVGCLGISFLIIGDEVYKDVPAEFAKVIMGQRDRSVAYTLCSACRREGIA